MKKIKLLKKIMMTVLSMSLVFGTAIYASADEPLYVHLGEIDATDNQLIMQVGTNLENSTEGISYKVTLGDEELDILSVSDYETEKLKTSYAFLVDVSGSIKKNEMDDMKNILKGLVNGMDENDNASIMLLGNDIYAQDFTSDKEVLLQSIEEIATLSEDTNLYYSINQAVDILTTSESGYERKCLVILSDGKDDQISGITEKEVEAKINDANIPICSIAVRGNNSDAIETAKIMGSFSRMSPGGAHMIFGVDGMDAEKVVETVLGVAKNIAVLKADISGYEANGTENYLQVEAVVEGVGSASDGYNVKSVLISKGIVKEVVEETEEVSEIVEKEVDFLSIAVVGIIVVILIAIVISIIVNQKKKKAKKTEENEVIESQNIETEKPEENLSVQEEVSNNHIEETEGDIDVIIPPSLEVQLTRVGNIETEVLTVVVKGQLIIGRKAEMADLVFADDQQLSGKHCRLVYDGWNLTIEDLGSLNGTLVNGVPISEPFYLESYDKIYIGSKEWRITW